MYLSIDARRGPSQGLKENKYNINRTIEYAINKKYDRMKGVSFNSKLFIFLTATIPPSNNNVTMNQNVDKWCEKKK